MASELLERESAGCLLCGSRGGILLSTQSSWPVCRCPDCGLIYLSERPCEASLSEFYGSEYYDAGTTGYCGYERSFELFGDVFRKLFERRDRDLRRHVTTGRRLLEVGCAHGFLLDHLRCAGWDVEGVEVSPLSSGYASRRFGLTVHTGTVEDAPLREGSFDAVLLLDVLEHLHRPFDALGRIAGLLRPGGILVTQCPWELTHWEEAMQAVLRGVRTGAVRPDSIPAHLYFFSPRTLDAALEKGGFEIVARQSARLESPEARAVDQDEGIGQTRRERTPGETAHRAAQAGSGEP